ncbi:MAG TPA: hypothetical protein VJK52_00815 [Candidatus Nanoarchaeia archaeon]|nr:hypothetical protein [Candidatus Nanoarchaeia archaeon]
MDPERTPSEEEMPKGIGVVEISLTLIILILLAGSAGYYYLGREKPLSGQATLTPEGVESGLEKFFDRFPMAKFLGDGAKICIVVPIGATEQSFAIRKSDGVISIRRHGNIGCEGEGSEDFILHYTSADIFHKHIQDPACKNFLRGDGSAGFVYWVSLLWPPGNTPTCNVVFRERYCAALAYCVEPTGIGNLFSCCGFDQLSPLQQHRFQDARRLGSAQGQR